MQPGVGTNRFSYSFNDPINLADPSGNKTVYTDSDGDGDNEFYGHIGYGEPGFDNDFSETGIFDSEFVDFNNASKGGGSSGSGRGGSQTVREGCIIRCLDKELRFAQPVAGWKVANPKFIANHPLLGKVLDDPKFYAFALERLQAGNYLNYNQSWEMTGHIYVSKSGIRYDPLPKAANALRDSTPIAPPNARRKGETSVMFHTHPGSFSRPSGADGDLGVAGNFFFAKLPRCV